MNISPITTYKNIFNFHSNINFIKVDNKYQAQRAAELYSSDDKKIAPKIVKKGRLEKQNSFEYDICEKIVINTYNVFAEFINKLAKGMYKLEVINRKVLLNRDLSYLNELDKVTPNEPSLVTIELGEKDNKIIGGYRLDINKPYNNTFLVRSLFVHPDVRLTKNSKEFLLAVADRIYKKAISAGVKHICWNSDLQNPIVANLAKKRFKNENKIMDVSWGEIPHRPRNATIMDIDDFKKSIDEYKRTH